VSPSSRGFLVGLVGTGIGPSLTPPMHEREADALGLRYLYRRFDLDELRLPAPAIGDLVAAARLAGYDGLNVTHPCKQLVLAHLDELSPDAEALGAVNTVVFRDGRAFGHNTDWSGFARSFDRGLADATLDRVVLLGAGGAGAAVAHALLTLGTGRLTIADVDVLIYI
jgi:shikimate dehydrogenase